jgi:hypothetical protein
MKAGLFIVAFTCLVTCYGCGRMNAGTRPTTAANSQSSEKPSTTKVARVDFSRQIKPILEAKCQPCHFSGGKVYAQMPFDRPETVRTLGTKLFTRIKDENQRQLIRNFLAQE